MLQVLIKYAVGWYAIAIGIAGLVRVRMRLTRSREMKGAVPRILATTCIILGLRLFGAMATALH